MPRKVIDLFSETKRKYGTDFITPVLLTSVAAAYCDLKEYENALRCCNVDGETVILTPVSVGNPHAVIFVDDMQIAIETLTE